MINDILEQVAEDYFREQGYFTQHNVKYRPNNTGVHSDIDIIGVHPKKSGIEKVIVVSCKSWQVGLDINVYLRLFKEAPDTIVGGKKITKTFRELMEENWAKALKKKVYELTGEKKFKFYLAVIKYRGSKKDWENFSIFKENLPSCEINLIDMKSMVFEIQKFLTTTPANSELSRLLQLIKADNGKIEYGKTSN